LIGGDARHQHFFAFADGTEGSVEVFEEDEEIFGTVVSEQDVFVGAQAVNEAIATECGFAFGSARAGRFLGVLTVGVDLGLGEGVRLIRLFLYAYWRARGPGSSP
jgi:hypothetical protein